LDGSQLPMVSLRDTGSAVRSLDSDEAERKDLRARVIALRAELAGVKADRAARLEVIEAQGRRLGAVEGELNRLKAEVSLELGRIKRTRVYRLLRRLGRWKFVEQIAGESAGRSST